MRSGPHINARAGMFPCQVNINYRTQRPLPWTRLPSLCRGLSRLSLHHLYTAGRERTTCSSLLDLRHSHTANGRTIQQHLELCNLWPGPALHLSPPQPRILFSQVNQARLLSCSTPAVAGLCLTKIRNMNTAGLDWRIQTVLSSFTFDTAGQPIISFSR